MFNLQLKTPFTYVIAGVSQSGKSTHVFNLLKYKEVLFDVVPTNVIYFYNKWQPSFTDFQRQNIVTEWCNKLPNNDDIDEKTIAFREKNGSIVIIDDYMTQIDQNIQDLFTIQCHANNVNVLLLTQNLFPNNQFFRTISLNTTYLVIFKNPRDSSQISHYASQFSPRNSKYIVDVYHDVTRGAYSYLFFDHHQSTDAAIRIRSHILPHEGHMRVYTSKNCHT